MGAADARHGAFLDRRTDEGVPRRHHARRIWSAFHKQYVHPRNFILAVSGDFKTADLPGPPREGSDGLAGCRRTRP